ncbi:polysaccharide biosynthesis/export family protein [Longitalea arenae]|uniref:polysaccharide biosynthesis/export family protein n=1 Tax=Longitalea arenae TaxID=2812558 RepID=UPI00196826DA|nr:polysaccharide biosynthesis/export family protein [Longitalea arenae]
MKYLQLVIFSFCVIMIATSCSNVKNFQYLQGSFDTARISKVQVPEPVIQKGDLLNITVYSDDPLATAAVTRQVGGSASPLTLSAESSPSNISANAAAGYLVDQKGDLQLYKLERLHVEGMTKEQLADTLEYYYTKLDLLKNPYVEVRFLNYKITVIGEVTRPGPFTVPTDKISAFEAIGLAGDITISGRRDNVLVIREINGVRTFGRLNLQDPNVFLSPYYYLQQNDMVVVEPGKIKAAVNNQNTFQYVSLGATLLSITAVFISLFRR